MKKRFIFLIVIITLVVLGICGFFIYKNRPETKSYTITYNDEDGTRSKSTIKVSNYIVEVTTEENCSEGKCDEPKTKKFNYSKENYKKLLDYLKKNYSKENISIDGKKIDERKKDVLQGLLLGEYFFETEVEDYKYRIQYAHKVGATYDIYFKEDNSILVKKSTINDDYDIVKIDTYPLNFSKAGKSKLINYAKLESKLTNYHIIIKNNSLKKHEVNKFKSIVENDESYLKKDKIKLLYFIYYSGFNCESPGLYLYDDNTYEFYDSFTTFDEKLIPKTGNYNENLDKLIDRINKSNLESDGSFLITSGDGKHYSVDSKNKELTKFLNDLNVDMIKCQSQQK